MAATKGVADAQGKKGQGAGLAEALLNSAAAVSPNEDARGYVQQTVLPVLGPAIEQLLHHVAETGELQRSMNAQAEREGKPRRRKASKDLSSEKAAEKPSTPGADPSGGSDEPEEELGFDPLAWLADNLRQHTRGSAEKYKASIEQRVAELIQKQQ